MSLRWLTPGFALVVASLLSCDNQGKGVGTDVIEQLCELNREAVVALHSPEGMAAENALYNYTYCDYWVDTDGDNVPDAPRQEGSCAPLAPTDMDNIIRECRRNGARIQNRCWQEMEAILTCMTTQRDQASSRLQFFTDNFNCWYDNNGNGTYDGDTWWTWPNDGSRPDSEVNHPETCPSECQYKGTCGSCGYRDVLDATGNPVIDSVTGKTMQEFSDCYFMKELDPRAGEWLRYQNVIIVTQQVSNPETGRFVARSLVCGDEYVALNACAKESELFLTAARTANSGAAGAAGASTQ